MIPFLWRRLPGPVPERTVQMAPIIAIAFAALAGVSGSVGATSLDPGGTIG